MKQPFWSVIVPVYNETTRVSRLGEILDYLKGQKETWELVVVDDGSTDDTRQKLAKMNKDSPFRIVSYSKNQGKGRAVKEGMIAATGKHRLFIDIDLSTPIREMAKLEPYLGKYDCLIGTRKAKGANVVVHQPWLRENLGKGFTLLSQIMLGINVSDFTCGFKCFSEETANKVFGQCQIFRWGFDSEILYLCHKHHFSIKEIPVTWKNDFSSRVKFPQDLINSLSELIRIRYNDLILGLYQ